MPPRRRAVTTPTHVGLDPSAQQAAHERHCPNRCRWSTRAGYDIPQVTRASGTVTGAGGRVYTTPGGGYEMKFPYAVPPEFVRVVS